MENQDQNEDTSNDAAMAELELAALKTKADTIGLTYHPSISSAKLSAKIKAHLEADAKPADTPVADAPANATAEDAPLSKSGKIKAMKDKALALVRVNIVCMNPAKREWDGEIFAVGNANLPTQKKFIPFNTTDGYHIPKIMFDALKARKCPVFYNERLKTAFGVQTVRRMKYIPEFNIVELPPLTPAELKELARQQAAAAGLE